jgi:hypothetical protein
VITLRPASAADAEAQGFVVAEMTDGATNEEREPDIRYVSGGARALTQSDGAA